MIMGIQGEADETTLSFGVGDIADDSLRELVALPTATVPTSIGNQRLKHQRTQTDSAIQRNPESPCIRHIEHMMYLSPLLQIS